MPSNKLPISLLLAGAVAICAAVAYFFIAGSGESNDRRAATAAAVERDPAAPRAPAPWSSPTDQRRPAQPVAPPIEHARRFASPADRERLERELRDARAQRRAQAEPAVARDDGVAAEPAVLDAPYIRGAVDDLLPLISECHDLQQNPDLQGVVTVNFTIIAEPELGGLIETIDIETDEAMAEQAALIECVRETMLSLEFPPPEDGGEVVVKYPFHFTVEDGD